MSIATAIVVARGGSVRLSRKALRPFAGTTMLGHRVRTLLACPAVLRVIVASDDAEMLDEGRRHGAEAVANLDYAGDSRWMIEDTVHRVPGLRDADVVMWAHPTNPLISAGTYAAAIDCYQRFAEAGVCDSLASVQAVRRHAWYQHRPINFDPHATRHQLAADLEPVKFQDGAIFIQTRQRFLTTRYFYGDKPLLFETPAQEVADVDTFDDYAAACRAIELRGELGPLSAA
jgi:CMP-N,N'-diacetyllegionaminic acid synthase